MLFSAFLVANLIEYIGNLPTIGRGFLFFGFLGVSLYGLVFWVALPLYQLFRLDNYLSDKNAAHQIGAFFPEIKDKLLNTLELSQLDASANSLIGASIKQRTEELKRTDFSTAITSKENKKYFNKYLIAPVLTLLLILLIKPKIFTVSSQRLIHYDKAIVQKAPFLFDWKNKQLKGFKNEALIIELALVSDEAIPQKCFVHINGKRTLMTKENTGNFSFTVNRLFKDFELTFEAAGFQSVPYQVKVYDRPTIGNMTVKLDYPRYLKKKNIVLENTGALKIPEGTTVGWEISTSKTDEINFIFNKQKTITTTKNNKNFYLTKTLKKSSTYEIFLRNKQSKNTAPIKYQIDVIKDQYPNIVFKQFNDTLLYNYVLIGGSISDDYGLSRFSIFYRNADKNKSFKRKNIRLVKGQRTQEFFHEIQLDSLAIEEGEKLEYYLAVWDNDGVNGAKMYKTRKQSYVLPNKEGIERQLNKESEKTASDLSKSSDKSSELNKRLNKLQEELKGKKKLDWQDKKAVEKVMEQHKEFNKEIKKLSEQMQKEQIQNERFNKQDEELQKKIDHLNRLMDELLDDDTKKLMEELRKLLDENKDINEIQKKLDEMKANDEELQKELDRTIELYKKLKFDQKLDKNIKELDKLAQKQKELAKETTNKKQAKEELTKKQDKLNKDFKQLEKEMKALDKLNKDLKSPKKMDGMEKEQDAIKEEQQKSSDAIKSGANKKAGKSQEGASKKMEEMSSKMKEMQKSMEMEQAEEDLDNLRQILHNLLYLSFNQEELINSFKNIKQSNPLFVKLSQKQINLKQSSLVVEDSLYALASRVYQIEPYITKELGDMKKHLSESNEAIKARRKNYALTKQQYAMTSMNNLALLLDEVLQQMQQDMAQKKPGDQMCNKPGSGSKPNLGKMQKKLNDMIKELKDGQKKGRGLSQKVAKAAAQQQRIKQGLKQLQKEGNGGKELQKQIKELERLMEQTEKDLINKNISNQLIQRQQQINTKLLEAEKAAKKQGFDDKRESNTARTKESNYPPAFDKYIKEKEKQIEMIKTIPANLNPYYKKQVNKYFKRTGS